MKNFTKLLFLIILASGWQGLMAQSIIKQETFGTATTFAGIGNGSQWSETSGTTLTVGVSGTSPSTGYASSSPALTASGGSGIIDIGTTAGTGVALCTGEFSTNGTYSGYSNIALQFGYRISSSKYTGVVTVSYRIGTSGGFTTLATSTITAAGGNGPFTVQGSWAATAALPLTGATNAADIDLQFSIQRTSAGGNFEIDDITVLGQAPTPTLTVTPGTLSLYAQSPSTLQEGTYTISGVNLTGSVLITPPSGVLIGTTSGGESTSPITITETGGALTGGTNTIYVELSGSNPQGTFASANISNVTTGGNNPNVAVSGYVFAAPIAFTAGNIAVERKLAGSGIGVIDEYTTGGSLVQTIPISFTNGTVYYDGSSTSEGADGLSIDGQYVIATGYSSSTTDNGTLPANPRIFARVKYDGSVDVSTKLSDGTPTNGNMRQAASIDGSGFWLSCNNSTNNVDIYQAFGNSAAGSESYFQGTAITPNAPPLTNTRGIGIFDGNIYASVGSTVYEIPGTPTSNGQTATILTGIPSGGEGAKSIGFVAFDVDPSHPGPDVIYMSDLGTTFTVDNPSANAAGSYGVFKYVYSGGTWVNKGKVIGQTAAIEGQVVGNDIVLYTISNITGTTDTLYKITDLGAGNASTYTNTMSNNGIALRSIAGAKVAVASGGDNFTGVTFAPQPLAAASYTVTNTSGTSVSQNMLYGSNNNLLYQFSMVNNSSVTPALLTAATFTPSGTYSASNLTAFTLLYNTTNNFSTAWQVGYAAPTASGTAFTIPTGLSISPSGTGYFFVCASIGSTGNGNTVIINAPVDANFTLTDGGSATGSTYTGGGTNTIVPAQQVASTVSSIGPLYTTVGSASPWQEFKVSGSNLIANETVTFTTGTYFEMSTDSVTWVSGATSISLTPVSGTVAPTRILVRLKASAPASLGSIYSDNLTIASTNAINVVVAVSGVVGQPFTAGNLAVSRAAGNTSAAWPVYIDEFTTGGTLVQSIPLPTAKNGANNICTQSGSAGTVGLDHASLDGQYYLSCGFNAAVGVTSVTSQHNSSNGGTRDEVVARIKYDGTIDTRTHIINMYDANLIRSTASIDGTSFWVSGRSNNLAGTLPQQTDGGPGYVALAGSTATQLSPSVLNVESRNISIITSQLICSNPAEGSALNGISAIGIGVNTNTPQVITSIVGDTITPFGYVAFATDTTVNGINILYVADQTRGIFKYTQDAAGVWSPKGKLTGSANGISGKVIGTNIVLYVIEGARGTQNFLYSVTDPLGNANIAGNSAAITAVGTKLATAPSGNSWSSVDFAPVALGGTPSLAVSSALPLAGGLLPGSTYNVLSNITATASIAQAIVTSLIVTTAGTYVPADFNSGSFNLWYSLSNNFDSTAINIGSANVPTSGGSVTFSIAQPIAVGKTGHLFVTADLAGLGVATPGHTINITASSALTLADNGIVTGSTAADGVQTIDNCIGSGGVAYAGGGTSTNTNTVICSGTSASMGLHNYIATSIQWQQSPTGGNTTNDWTNVTSGTGATTVTYVTPTLTTTTYYRALVTNSCFEVASNTVTVYVSATPVVTLTNVTPTSVSASWTPFALNSNVKYSLTCTGASSQVFSPVTNNPQTITVTSGSALNVTVAQINPAGCAVSGNASINTQLAAPTLTLSAAAARGFTASWTPVTGATSYTLYYREVGGNGGNSTLTTSSLTATLTGLYGDAIYLVYVVANEAGYTGATSTEQYISTLPGTSTCATPTNIVVSSNCANQISVTMSGSPSNIYRVTFTRLSPNPSAAASYNVTGGAVNITIGVQYANSFWQVLVASNCSGVSSEIANPQYIFIKAACPQLTNLVLSTPTCHGFVATWNGGTCTNTQTNAEDYYLYVQKQGAVSWNAYPVGSNPYITASWVAAGSWNAYVTQLGCNGSSSAASTVQTITTGLGCRTEEEVQADNSSSNDVEQGNAAMNIYPNPTNGNFMVNVYTKNKPDEMVQMEMVNTLGQVVFTVIAPVTNGISNNTFQVPANVASGMYIIRTVAGGENLTKEVMYTK